MSYRKIFDHYGLDHQLGKTVEECAELIVAITHWKDGKVSREDMVTEIADVAVMVEQLKLAFPDVEAEIARKVERCGKRLESGEVG